MPAEDPDNEKDQEKKSRWQPRDKKSQNAGAGNTGSSAISNIFRKARIKKDSNPEAQRPHISGSQDATATASEVAALLEEMRKLGLRPEGLGKFIKSLHKLAVASGVMPENLAFLLNELDDLSQGKQMSISGARKYVKELLERQKLLQKSIQDLERKQESAEVELSLKQLQHSATKDTLSEFLHAKEQLEQHHISFSEISKLITLLQAARAQGYESSALIKTLSDQKLQQHERDKLQVEIEKLLESKRVLQDRIIALEQDFSSEQQSIASAAELKKLGIAVKELEELQSLIRMISQTRNIDAPSAMSQLLTELQRYYANDQEFRKRIRVLESLIAEKEEKFNMLEADYQNEKAVLENASMLISKGVDEQWLAKLQTVVDAYGVDIDSLANELGQRQGLKARIEELSKTARVLEEEERLLRQKVVATEDQRLRTLSLINEMILKRRAEPLAERPLAAVAAPSPTPLKKSTNERDELLSSKYSNEAEFMAAAQEAVGIICSRLRKGSAARLVLEHALLALKYETKQDRKS